jgi:ADP-heptose:LPS heptosyltransferase
LEALMGWGDEMMAAGQARQVFEATGMKARILDRHGRPRWHVLWDGSRHVARPHEPGKFQAVTNGAHARPYVASITPHCWKWKKWDGPTPAEIKLTPNEKALGAKWAGRVILEPTTKHRASPNKDWGWVRWGKLAWLLQREGFRVSQIGLPETPLLEGAELIITPSYRDAIAVLSTAAACAVPEGGLHHAAAAVGAPAVVLFGGYIHPSITGYDGHINLFTGGTACGMRVHCDHCKKAMAKIEPEQVFKHMMEILREGN